VNRKPIIPSPDDIRSVENDPAYACASEAAKYCAAQRRAWVRRAVDRRVAEVEQYRAGFEHGANAPAAPASEAEARGRRDFLLARDLGVSPHRNVSGEILPPPRTLDELRAYLGRHPELQPPAWLEEDEGGELKEGG